MTVQNDGVRLRRCDVHVTIVFYSQTCIKQAVAEHPNLFPLVTVNYTSILNIQTPKM